MKTVDDWRLTVGYGIAGKDYLMSKGTIHLPADKPLPYRLITKMVRARVAEIEETG